MATKKVPQRRNKNAGKSTGKSKSAKYFKKNPKARKKKNAYNTKYHSTPAEKKKRAATNKKRNELKKKGKISKNQDVSHKKNGKTTVENRSKNRARNGRGGRPKKK